MPDSAQSLQFWSTAVFWFVAINAVVSLMFVLVVMVGGFFDLRYLLKALREEPVDLCDDGRVRESAAASTDPVICQTCGYHRTGNVSAACPECGTPMMPPTDAVQDRPRPSSPRRL